MKWTLWSLIPDLSFLFLRKKKKTKLQSLGDNIVPVVPESCACSSSSSEEEALLEMAREALASRRLSFEEDESCSVLSMVGFPFKDCLVLAVESENPKIDFLHSMEQITKAYNGFMKPGGEMDWDFLEVLLTWFLRINNMKNQDVIVAAFVDLCLLLSSSS